MKMSEELYTKLCEIIHKDVSFADFISLVNDIRANYKYRSLKRTVIGDMTYKFHSIHRFILDECYPNDLNDDNVFAAMNKALRETKPSWYKILNEVVEEEKTNG